MHPEHCEKCGKKIGAEDGNWIKEPDGVASIYVCDFCEQLAEAQGLYEQTTQGEWGQAAGSEPSSIFANCHDLRNSSLVASTRYCGLQTDKQNEITAQWIAAAHNLWPKLIARAQSADAVWDEAIRIVRDTWVMVSFGKVLPQDQSEYERNKVLERLEAARNGK